jgi:hypothetical protein
MARLQDERAAQTRQVQARAQTSPTLAGVAMTLARLSHAINTAQQLTQTMRGRELNAETADKIAGRLKEAARLVQGKWEVSSTGHKPKAQRAIRAGRAPASISRQRCWPARDVTTNGERQSRRLLRRARCWQ